MKWNKLPLPYGYFILIGLGLGLLLALRAYLPYIYWGDTEKYNFQRMGIPHIINYVFWGMLVPIVYYFTQKYPLIELSQKRVAFKAILVSIIIALAHESLTNIIWLVPLHVLGLEKITSERMDYVIGSLPSAIISRLIEYWILFFIFAALSYYKKYKDKQIELAKLESQLSNAELNALRLQLHPHFLFNTLNTISSLMEINIKDAQKIVSKLGLLLRTLLDKERENFIPLHEELNFIKSYLDIEQVRFHDRLRIQYDIAEDTLEVPVPALILQPLVENAIKHGFAKQTGPGIITLTSNKVNNYLEWSVKDDGNGSAYALEILLQSGIGLKNVKERLELLYGEAAIFSITTAPGAGFEVQLRLPIHV